MKQVNRTLYGLIGVGTILLLGLPSFAQSQSRPGIFNEPPYNRTGRPVKQPGPLLPPTRTPDGTVQPVDGKVTVKLINKTGTSVLYQIIGDTAQRTLTGRSDVTLQALETPTNVTFYRPDRGFLIVGLQATQAPGTLEVTLTESADQDAGRSAMLIQPTGEVYLD